MAETHDAVRSALRETNAVSLTLSPFRSDLDIRLGFLWSKPRASQQTEPRIRMWSGQTRPVSDVLDKPAGLRRSGPTPDPDKCPALRNALLGAF